MDCINLFFMRTDFGFDARRFWSIESESAELVDLGSLFTY